MGSDREQKLIAWLGENGYGPVLQKLREGLVKA